jgi:hypothetical protein
MTDQEWLEAQEVEIAKEGLELAKERALGRARLQLYVTQRELRELVELREAIEFLWAQKDELWADIMAAMEGDYEFLRRCVEAALESGARVEQGKLEAEVVGKRPRRGWRGSLGRLSRWCMTKWTRKGAQTGGGRAEGGEAMKEDFDGDREAARKRFWSRRSSQRR